MGTAYRFNMYHIMRTPHFAKLFPLEVVEL